MSVGRAQIESLSAQTGFRPATLEKVIRLGQIVADITRQPMLSRALALKGGTALNLCFGAPHRLSVDLDFNYVSSPEREDMLRDRPLVQHLIEQLARGHGYHVQWSPDDHAGRTAHLRYRNATGTPDDIQVDLNFLFRVPLGEMSYRPMWQPGDLPHSTVQVVPFSELAAGKLVATVARGLPRDLFDTRRLPEHDNGIGDLLKLKRIFVAVAGTLPRPLSAYGRQRLRVTDQQVRQQLVGMLLRDEHVTADDLNEGTWSVLEPLLALDEAEQEYTDRLQRGELLPDLLFPNDPEMADRVRRHPALLWKAQNAKDHAAAAARRGK